MTSDGSAAVAKPIIDLRTAVAMMTKRQRRLAQIFARMRKKKGVNRAVADELGTTRKNVQSAYKRLRIKLGIQHIERQEGLAIMRQLARQITANKPRRKKSQAGATTTKAQWKAAKKFTTREDEVLVLVAKKKGNQAIADKLGISVLTAAVHTRHIRKKLDIMGVSRGEFVAIANGLVYGTPAP